MAGDMAAPVILVVLIALIILLLAALDHYFTLPFLQPSGPEQRDLFVAIEDLLLPMGSFTNEILHPGVPTVDDCALNPAVVTSSAILALDNSGFNHIRMCLTDKPTAGDSTSKPNLMPHPTGPIPSNGESSPSPTLALIDATPIDGRFQTTVMSPETGPASKDAERTSIAKPLAAEPKPEDSQSFGPDDVFFDSIEYQLPSDENSLIAASGVEVPFLEQQGSEANSVAGASDVVGKEEQQEEQHQREEEQQEGQQQEEHQEEVHQEEVHQEEVHQGEVHQEEVHQGEVQQQQEPQQEPQQQEEEDSTTVEKEPATEIQAFDKAIRELVDPEGECGPAHNTLIEHIAGIMHRQAETEENLRSEKVRFQRAEDDLRNDWEDMKDVFDRIISGQNEVLQLVRQKNDELVEEKEALLSEKDRSKEKFERMKEQFNTKIRELKADKAAAEEKAKTDTSHLEGRIDAMEERFEMERSAIELSNREERNSLVYSRRLVEDQLAAACEEVTVSEQQHKAAMKEKDKTLQDLRVKIRQLTTTVKKAEDLEVSMERVHRKQLNDQRTKKDQETSTINDQLREARDKAKAADQWKAKAVWERSNNERTRNHLTEENTILREDQKHVVSRLKLDIRGLERTIATNEATIMQLEGKLAGFESGEKLQGLKSELQKSQRQLRISVKKEQDLRKELQNQQHEKDNFKGTIKARDIKIKQDADNSSKEKQSFQQEIQKLKEQGKDLSRKLNNATDAESKARTDNHRLEEEKNRTTTEHQGAMKKKDDEVHRLSQKVQDAKASTEQKTNEARKEANKLDGDKEPQHENNKKEAVDDALKNAAADAMNEERQHEDDKKKAVDDAVEQAAEDAKEKEKQQEQEKKEAVEKVSESIIAHPAEPQSGNNFPAVLSTAAAEAKRLLSEFDKVGAEKGTHEHIALKNLVEAKLALHNVKRELQKPQMVVDKDHLVRMLRGVYVSDREILRLNQAITPELLAQAQVMNAKRKNLENILATNGSIQKDAMLEAIRAPNPYKRETRTLRGLKRHTQPGPSTIASNSSTGVQAGDSMGQSQQTEGKPEQKYDPRLFDEEKPKNEPQDQPEQKYDPRLFDEKNPTNEPQNQPEQHHDPRLFDEKPPKNEPQDQPEMPVGWTDANTNLVTYMLRQGDAPALIEQTLRANPELEPNSTEVLGNWVKKIQSDHERETEGRAQRH